MVESFTNPEKFAKLRKAPKKMMMNINNYEKKLDKLKTQVRCSCSHKKGGAPDLLITGKRTGDGRKIYKCKQCGKELVISSYPKNLTKQNDGTVVIGYEDALEAVRYMIDIVKVMQNEKNKADRKRLDYLGENQYFLTEELPKMYEATLQLTKKSNKKKNNTHRDVYVMG